MTYKHNQWNIWYDHVLKQSVALLGLDKYKFLWSLFNLQVWLWSLISLEKEKKIRGRAKCFMNMTSLFYSIVIQRSRSGSTKKFNPSSCFRFFYKSNCMYISKQIPTKSLIWFNNFFSQKTIWRPTETAVPNFKPFINTFNCRSDIY